MTDRFDYLANTQAKLGFGLMRLPRIEGAVDIPQLNTMVDRFLDAGLAYFDTAFGYEDSEVSIGKALVQRHPRESFLLASKIPAFAAPSKEASEQMLYTSLERTGAGYFDYFLLHNLGAHRTAYFEDWDTWSFLAARKAEGLIKHVGFSFHDKAKLLDEVLTRHPETEFVQLQINYTDWDDPRFEARECYEVARAHNTPIIIMEPVRGGDLTHLPPVAAELFKATDPASTPASWALRFAASLEGVIVILSGMSNTQQMEENILTLADPQPFSVREREVLDTVRTEIDKIPTVPCTACEYCLKPCSQRINIPGILEAVNQYARFGDKQAAGATYGWNTDGHKMGKASDCIACGSCEVVCPQHIEIIAELEKAADLFEAKQA
ncbi:MAG: aldo/keto reductase [Coriobacteriales bacterium]|jgi:predicted aldo/keto reductase-like oxidoreductase|nr:aldo/keto reductase [Coriobacteriales bacterium]